MKAPREFRAEAFVATRQRMRSGRRERGGKWRARRGGIDAGEIDAANFGRGAQADEIILKRQAALVGLQHRPDRVVAHRHDRVGNAKPRGERAGYRGQSPPLGEQTGALDMGR